MSWLNSSNLDKCEKIEEEIDRLENKLSYLENINGIQRGTGKEIENIEREIDKLRLELRCMEAGL